MTFTPNIPISGESLGSTRDRTRGNFQETDAVFAVNHVGFNNTGKGKHPFLQMPEQATAPTTLANECGFYPKVGTNPAETNLFFRGESDGFEYQLTNADEVNNATFGTYTVYDGAQPDQQGGWTFLPGGLLMQYGVQKYNGSFTSKSVTFAKAFSQIYTANFTLFNQTKFGWAYIDMISNTGFRAQNTINQTSTTYFYWTALGKA